MKARAKPKIRFPTSKSTRSRPSLASKSRPVEWLACHERLRQNILRGVYPPGTRLVERTLCQELNVTRSTLRTALHHLAADGLIRLVPGEGASINSIKPEDAKSILEVRGVLEGLAARLAAQCITEEQLSEQAMLLGMIRGALQRHEYPQYLQLVQAFHQKIVEASGNKFLRVAFEAATVRLVRYRTDILLTGHVEELFRGQERIFDAIKARDPQQAERAAREHVDLVQQAICEVQSAWSSLNDMAGNTDGFAGRMGDSRCLVVSSDDFTN